MAFINVNEIPNEVISITGDIVEINYPRQGYTSDVAIIKSKKGLYVLKRTKGRQYCSWLRDEVIILKSLSSIEVPIPKVHLYKEEENKDQAWCLMNYLKGSTMRNALLNENNHRKRYEMIFNYGKSLALIHSTSCPKELINEGQIWLDEMLKKAEFNLLNYKTDGTFELLEYLKQNKPPIIPNTLIHGDFTIDNVLVEDGIITGIIDWNLGGYGDPRYDVALAIRPKSNVFQTDKEVDIFFEGYGNCRLTKEEYNYFQDGGLYEFF